MSLKDKVAIVTGGGSGIGEATSLLLAQKGATVAIGDLDSRAALAVATKIREAGGQATNLELDVTSISSVESFVGEVLQRYQRIDILVNNVGSVVTFTDVLQCPESDWDKTFDRNVKSVFYMSRTVLPAMVRARSGSIVNLGSAAGLAGRRNLAAYSAAKGAIIALTRAMAHDYGRAGIRVNCVCPGPTVTPSFLRSVPAGPDGEAKLKARAEQQPLGTLGQPLDAAQAIVFLASDLASWITGIALPVDGGNTAI